MCMQLITNGDDPLVHIDPEKGDAQYLLKLGFAFACLALETIIAIVGSGIYSKVAFFIFLIQMTAIFVGAGWHC